MSVVPSLTSSSNEAAAILSSVFEGSLAPSVVDAELEALLRSMESRLHAQEKALLGVHALCEECDQHSSLHFASGNSALPLLCDELEMLTAAADAALARVSGKPSAPTVLPL